jgi:glyoxylase-like metal-dependent hydrolase (beta-lactamase superfamily II)
VEENSLFSGDTILGGSSGEFTDYARYITSLQRVRELGVERVYPGHGQVEDSGVVGRYISHRQDRERQVLAALRGSQGLMGVEGLTERVYEGEAVPSQLVATAQRIVRLMLVKLREDGTATETEDGLWGAT